jgi:calcineurin-like phosphoesterase family protein
LVDFGYLTHFGHHGILKFGQRPANHELVMLSNWIDRIRDTDKLLHLGDVFMGSKGNAKRWAKVLSRMPGQKYVIVGNHDEELHDVIVSAGFEIVPPFLQDGVWFTHEPVINSWLGEIGDEWHTNIHGHTHANEWTEQHDGIPVPGKTYINVCVEHTDLAPVQYGHLLPRIGGDAA